MLTTAKTVRRWFLVLGVCVLGACGGDSGGSSGGAPSSGAAESAGAGSGARSDADASIADAQAGPTTRPGAQGLNTTHPPEGIGIGFVSSGGIDHQGRQAFKVL